MIHDLSEFSSSTLLARIFELEEGVGYCACQPGVENCELDDIDVILTELDDRNYGTDHPRP